MTDFDAFAGVDALPENDLGALADPTAPYVCQGCGETLDAGEVTDDWHVVVDHHPQCDGGPGCETTCPIQLQCGPVQ